MMSATSVGRSLNSKKLKNVDKKKKKKFATILKKETLVQSIFPI